MATAAQTQAKSTRLDRLVGVFSPKAQRVRLQERARVALMERAFEGASRADGWRVQRADASADADFMADGLELRRRSRDLYKNVGYIKNGHDAHVAQMVGTGIVPIFEDKKLQALWDAQFEQMDADGSTDFFGLQGLIALTEGVDGEVLIRVRPRRADDGLRVPVQFQVLEIDWLDSYKNGKQGKNTIINGIERDALGRVVAYWLYDEHPGQMGFMGGLGLQSRRVDARYVIHYYRKTRPGQGRGIPRGAATMARVRDLHLYEDAELSRKNLEARLGVINVGDASAFDALRAGDGAATPTYGPELPSGGVINLPGAESGGIHTIEPKAAGGYTDYVVNQLHLVAAGYGWTYEMMTGDVSRVNFSSARVRQNDYRCQTDKERWQHLIPSAVKRMCDAFGKAAEMAGEIAQYDGKVDFSTPKWAYVNPQQDVMADWLEITFGLNSWQEKMRQRGYQPEKVRAELKADIEAMKEADVLDVLMMMQKNRPLSELKPAEEERDAKTK